MLDGGTLPAGTVLFTHFDEATGEENVYSVTHLWLAVDKAIRTRGFRPTRVPIDRKFAKFCKENRGIERHRLNRIKAKHLTNPILLLQAEDRETVLLVDGNHRYVKAAILMKRTIPAYIIPPEMWHDCVVSGLETSDQEALVSSYSGIK